MPSSKVLVFCNEAYFWGRVQNFRLCWLWAAIILKNYSIENHDIFWKLRTRAFRCALHNNLTILRGRGRQIAMWAMPFLSWIFYWGVSIKHEGKMTTTSKSCQPLHIRRLVSHVVLPASKIPTLITQSNLKFGSLLHWSTGGQKLTLVSWV